MKVLVCGSRYWLEQAPIERELRKLPEGTVIIHGACRGADNIAGYVAEMLGFEVRPYPAPWDLLGPGAGIVRNQQMLDEEHPDRDGVLIDKVLVFHKDPKLGKGTRDMVGRAGNASPFIPITVFSQ